MQRHILYLGEINDSQEAAWRKTLEIFEEGKSRLEQIALFPEERAPDIDIAPPQPSPEIESKPAQV